ncbi:possible lactate/malate dehydrogenase, alpha/beta [Prochlorococcus marinus str. MIT 9515]|uniref:Possible lactate/malate dehydrogenase, alpha/beta n=1 Tax=Prochlorococcus marinus (strain MIT 9515) TaxID=167542 RepID=A2BX11_PROM5|nr:possible lactate/malate dehydrogenase, alpha/beta [Prochlorococcus marinus str. MIT 9515]
MILLIGLNFYRNLSISSNLRNEEKKNKLKKSADILYECFDLKNKSQRNLKESMILIEYCLKEYRTEK